MDVKHQARLAAIMFVLHDVDKRNLYYIFDSIQRNAARIIHQLENRICAKADVRSLSQITLEHLLLVDTQFPNTLYEWNLVAIYHAIHEAVSHAGFSRRRFEIKMVNILNTLEARFTPLLESNVRDEVLTRMLHECTSRAPVETR